jgi:UDP-glucose 4-epimerase
MKKILVTGGLGYIGSHTVVSLCEAGFEPIIVDNFSNSHPSVLEGIKKLTGRDIKLYPDEIRDRKAMHSIFIENEIWGVIHFAAFKYVGESTENPYKYYLNNVDGLLSILGCMREFNVDNIIFSSSCSVYGNSENQPVTENMFRYNTPESPYGHTKQIGETIVEEVARTSRMRAISLRYFNPAGSHPSIEIGELPNRKESNLFPIMCDVVLGKRDKLIIHGGDYKTNDGTCIRDFIHVCDLAEAHVKSLEALEQFEEGRSEIINVGTGEGKSVLECVKKFRESNSIDLKYEIGARRNGDVEQVWAETSKCKKIIGWEPKRSLEDICRSSFLWAKKAAGN